MAEVGNRGEIYFSELLDIFHQDADKRTLEAVVDTMESMKFAQKSYGSGDTKITYIKK